MGTRLSLKPIFMRVGVLQFDAFDIGDFDRRISSSLVDRTYPGSYFLPVV